MVLRDISIKLAQRYPSGFSSSTAIITLSRSIHLVQSAGRLTVSGILLGSNPFVPRALGHNQLLGFAASRMLLCLVLYAVLP